MTRRALDDSVLALEPELRLRASQCPHCAQVDFPARELCTGCRRDAEPHLLPQRGTIWTWTTQNYPPASPPYAVEGEHEPFLVGYVDLDGCCVESRLDMRRTPQIGEQVELVTLPLVIEDVGEVVSYAFRPKEGR